jgi:NAD(P)-dependent dehydrogenase (short-subunit alcohol dehydrogenase family)
MKKKVTLYKLPDLFSLRDKVAIISGVGGIGTTLAKAFGVNGAKIIITDLNEKIIENAKKKLSVLNIKADTYEMDVTKKNNVEKVFKKIKKKYETIDIVIITSGIGMNEKAIKFKEKDIDNILNVNLKGTILCNQIAGRIMVKQKSGKIINIGSIGGHLTHTLASMPYAASKAGVHQITRSFAAELAEYNINVNAIAPAWVNTPMIAGKEKSYYERIYRNTPFGRMLETEELLGAAIFLATDASNFVTGQTIFVDGGWSTSKT